MLPKDVPRQNRHQVFKLELMMKKSTNENELIYLMYCLSKYDTMS